MTFQLILPLKMNYSRNRNVKWKLLIVLQPKHHLPNKHTHIRGHDDMDVYCARFVR